MFQDSVCPRNSDPFYIVSHNIKWVTTAWTYSIRRMNWINKRVHFLWGKHKISVGKNVQ